MRNYDLSFQKLLLMSSSAICLFLCRYVFNQALYFTLNCIVVCS